MILFLSAFCKDAFLFKCWTFQSLDQSINYSSLNCICWSTEGSLKPEDIAVTNSYQMFLNSYLYVCVKWYLHWECCCPSKGLNVTNRSATFVYCGTIYHTSILLCAFVLQKNIFFHSYVKYSWSKDVWENTF